MEEKTVKVFVSGCTGRMGKLVVEAVNNHPGWEVCGGFGRRENDYDFPVLDADDVASKWSKAYDFQDIEKPDIIIDFSSPTVAEFDYFNLAYRFRIPMVCGTTKLSDLLINSMYSSKFFPVFQAYNLSYDVYAFTKAVAEIVRKLPGCDIDVTEIHHTGKEDAPSGTANNLADAINDAIYETLGGTYAIVPNPSCKGLRKPYEIHIHSERRGSVVGTHIVTLSFANKCNIVLSHEALSRKIFADGAIKAAEFLLTQPAGYYNMDSLANL